MNADRVDKSWQKKGLSAFSTQAIFGTLGHYGAAMDEGEFRKQASGNYPLQVAERWLQSWKGTGQFAHFPVAAADELYRRLFPDQLMPSEYALALVRLMTALDKMREGAPDAPVGESFKSVESLNARLPRVEGRPSAEFMTEVLFHLNEWLEHFNQLAEELAREGHLDDAETFAELEELLFPDRLGTAKAIVRAARGEKAEAVADLEALAASSEAGEERRLSAVDALLHLEAFEAGKRHALPLFEAAEAQQDFHTALDVAQRLNYAIDKLGVSAEHRKLLQRIEALEEAHHKAHPGHHHHH